MNSSNNYLQENPGIKIPVNLDAESHVIGCALSDESGETLTKIKEIISANDFYHFGNRLVFNAVEKTFEEHNLVDQLLVIEFLKTEGSLEEIGISGLLSYTDKISTTLQVIFYAKIVREKSLLRQTIRKCKQTVEQAEEDTDASELIQGLEDFVTDLQPGMGVQKISETSAELLEEYELMKKGEFTVDVVRTHIDHLDSKLGNGGLGPAEVCVVAAPTSCGKSALALNIALRAARNDSVPTLIFSLEMPARQITKRFVQAISGVNLKHIQDGVITEDKMEKVRDSFRTVNKLPIYTEHTVKSIQDLAIKTKTMVKKKGVKLVVIDYLQLVPWDSRLQKHDGIAEVSHKIKQLALETNVSVLLLCQVNREGARRGSGLGLYDLKDSGDIENDADIAILMYPKGGDIEDCKTVDNVGPLTNLEYIVAKNREGERGVRGQFIFRHLSGRFY